MALDISTFVDITTQVACGRRAAGAVRAWDADYHRWRHSQRAGSGKVQLYTTLNGFSADFDAGDAMDAATVWFSPPIPSRKGCGWAGGLTTRH